MAMYGTLVTYYLEIWLMHDVLFGNMAFRGLVEWDNMNWSPIDRMSVLWKKKKEVSETSFLPSSEEDHEQSEQLMSYKPKEEILQQESNFIAYLSWNSILQLYEKTHFCDLSLESPIISPCPFEKTSKIKCWLQDLDIRTLNHIILIIHIIRTYWQYKVYDWFVLSGIMAHGHNNSQYIDFGL